MPQHTIYGEDGVVVAKPYANALQQWDDDTRTYTDFRTTPPTTRPYTADENAAADLRAAAAAQTDAETKLAADLRNGIAAIVTAKNAAIADSTVAATAKTQAEALSTQVAARKTSVDTSTPAATLAYITAMRGEISYLLAQVKVIVDAVALLQGWRRAVDENAVTTDNALLWLAKQSTGDVTAPESRPAN